MENKIIDTGKVSEYRIGGTTYFVRTVFNCQNESLDEIIQRLIVNDCKKSSVNTDEITDSTFLKEWNILFTLSISRLIASPTKIKS